MTSVTADDTAEFFREVEAASKKAVWCALATVDRNSPRVRIVHPTWDGQVLWLATGPQSAKVRQIRANPTVEVQFQVAPPEFVHVVVRGRAELCDDPEDRRRAWDVIDYDLTAFGSKGPDDPNFLPVKILPERVELSEMFGSVNKRVWQSVPRC